MTRTFVYVGEKNDPKTLQKETAQLFRRAPRKALEIIKSLDAFRAFNLALARIHVAVGQKDSV